MNIIFRVHAIQRMFERGVSAQEVRSVLERGEVVEDYSDETPNPSRLLLGWRGRHPLHVVAEERAGRDETIVVTAYVPDRSQWGSDFKRRRR